MWFAKAAVAAFFSTLVVCIVSLFVLVSGLHFSGTACLVIWTLTGLALSHYFHNLHASVPAEAMAQNAKALKEWSDSGYVDPDKIAKSVFMASRLSKGGYGTAFLLDNGIVVTNRHVVDGETKLALSGQKVSRCPAVVKHVADADTRPDLAFLCGRSLTNRNCPGLPLATEMPKPGDKLLVVGNPVGRYHRCGGRPQPN